MQRLIVEGGHSLKGTVVPSGNKNSAQPILAACLLTDEQVTLDNVPRIRDVETIISILQKIGVDVSFQKEQNRVTVRAKSLDATELDPELCELARGSVTLAGPMLARCGRVRLPRPGGDKIGRRRIDTHILALRQMGARIEPSYYFYDMEAPNGLKGADILLDEASVTATESTIMAASTAKGETIIRNAASEPHVQELCCFLNMIGARISGIGSNTITVEGTDSLGGGTHTVESDYQEIGSFIGLASVTDSEILIKGAVPHHMRMTLMVFKRLGIQVEVRGQDILVPEGQNLKVESDLHGAILKIDDAPWPGFPPDLMSIALVVATQAEGTVLIFEKMYESRLFFVDRLIEMGAKIILCDPHRAVVQGPSKLHGETVVSPDIRAGMGLLIASLCAQGTSVMHNIGQIDRGYERIDEKLKALGAKIQRA